MAHRKASKNSNESNIGFRGVAGQPSLGVKAGFAVVAGDVWHNLEGFIRTQLDKRRVMQRSNVVDLEPYSEAVETAK